MQVLEQIYILCLNMCDDKWGSDFRWNKWQSELLWIFELKYLFIVGLNQGYLFYKENQIQEFVLSLLYKKVH
jgi:hypothetical protein